MYDDIHQYGGIGVSPNMIKRDIKVVGRWVFMHLGGYGMLFLAIWFVHLEIFLMW